MSCKEDWIGNRMNVLFLTLLDFDSIDEHNIYTDLLREFVKHDHNIYIFSDFSFSVSS